MQKIETIFKRDPNNLKLVLNEASDADIGWVFTGRGVPTVKVDGTCCLYKGGQLYRRHALKVGRPVPIGWLHWTMDPEQKSGHGWLPVTDTPADDYHREGLGNTTDTLLEGRSYELVGPKINGNPYGLDKHELWLHGSEVIPDGGPARTFEAIREWLTDHQVEGIVWWYVLPGGVWGDINTRMAKIKRRDFGLQWPV